MIARWHGVPYHDINANKWLLSFETDETPKYTMTPKKTS